MANGKYIGVKYPFKESPQGFFIDLNSTDRDEIKSDLLHLILTRRGQRYYLPEFGTNLLQFIFEPNDIITHSDIEKEIKDTVKKYIPNLTINSVIVEQSKTAEFVATVTIDYTVTEGALSFNELVIINI